MDTINRFIEYIERYTPDAPAWQISDEDFDELARSIFSRQFEQNLPYRAFCQGRGVSSDTVRTWRDIPAVPTDVFKHVRLSCADEATTARTFRTSGTTQSSRGAHHFGSLAAYSTSLLAPFARMCLPDRDRIKMFIIHPHEDALPDSSLSFMLSALAREFGARGTRFFVRRDGDELTYLLDELVTALDEATADDEPVMILSTAFGLMNLFDRAPDARWRLPVGSRLMETGGFKGKSREVSRETLYELFDERFGIPASHCVSEYSMTELSSQAYTDNLRAHYCSPGSERPTRLVAPPWAKLVIVDPVTLEPIDEPDVVGLIRWIDLANTESVCVVQTSDMGRVDALGRLELLGRDPDSELRGCSLTIEEVISAEDSP